MHEILDRFALESYEFVTEFDSGADFGGELSILIQQSSQTLLHRTFYFSDGHETHVRAFAQKFAQDEAYREACLNGTVKWARVNRWFWINNWVYSHQFITIWAASDRQAVAAMQHDTEYAKRRLKRLHALIEQRIDEWEASAAYQEHVEIERQSSGPSMQALDPGIEMAVRLFNGISGVVTQFSCEGIRRGLRCPEWNFGPIWFPAKHMPLAHIAFGQVPESLAAELDAILRQAGVGHCRARRAEADCPEHNAEFVRACEQFARTRNTTSAPLWRPK